MKTSQFLLVVASASIGALTTGCFEGPNGIPGNHAGNDAPIVVTDAPEGLASLDVDVTFTAYDPDSNFVTVWDACPNPDAPDAAPILNVSYSVDGGGSFQPIDPADLLLDGDALVVPTCGEVKRFDDSIRIAVSTSGEEHTFTWSTLDYVPTSADVTFRVSVNDGSFQSLPGDSDEFPVANLPSFDAFPNAARPGDVLDDVELSGLLTTWGITTVVGSADNLIVTDFQAITTTAATVDIEMGPDTEQIPREFHLITPGAGVPSGDEDATGVIWTCAELGQEVEEFETTPLGGGPQPVCDQGLDWGIAGALTAGDDDLYEFVANSAGDAAVSLDWDSSDAGDVTDYDLFVIDPNVGLAACADSFTGCDCGTIAKPEECTISGLTPGGTYWVYVSHYAGSATTYTVTIGSGP